MTPSKGNSVNRVCILGAGLAGLSAADLLSDRNYDVIVLEKDDHSGGLASTFKENHFHYDCGPHRFHTRNPEILEYVRKLLPDQMLTLERLSRIRLLDQYFYYPLALGDVFRHMPFLSIAGITASYLWEKIRNLLNPRDESVFENWVIKRFGKKLYDIYFGPYTEKLWGCKATELSSDWANQRITVPSLSGLIRTTLFPSKDIVRSLVSTFHYPVGGIGRICEALAHRVVSRGGRILYRSEPLAIRKNENEEFILTTNQGELTVDYIVNTIPVTDYVSLLGRLLPEEVHAASCNLHFRAIVFLVIKLKNRVEAHDHWIYTPEECYLFNRLSVPENFDPDCSSEGSQIVFEFSCNQGDDIWNGNVDLTDLAIKGGEKLGLFRSEDVIETTITRQAYAYPVYDLDYSSNISIVLDAVQNMKNTVTCGRQGLFRYNNMDHSVEMGQCAAMEICGEHNTGKSHIQTTSTWSDG